MDIRRKPPNPKVRVEKLEYAIPHEESEARNILEEIVWYKDTEIENFKKLIPLDELIKKIHALPPTKGFIKKISEFITKPAVIAEIKKASPSKGVIRENFNPIEIASTYEEIGVSCISVLTDNKFFQGGFEILSKVRETTDLPLLCKDFILSAYQIYKARISGADAILLIAAILNDSDLIYLKKIADKLNMDVLVEIHNKKELERVLDLKCFNLIGINNRNLKTFQTNLEVSLSLIEKYSNTFKERNILVISESGINNYEDLDILKLAGFSGVLIGELFMRDEEIKNSFNNLLNSV
tara:strand:+ start:409 stop:1296 length:888 start_codon:yes stop_codon:yes gene_type:complete